MEQENFKEDYLSFLDGIRGLLAFWVFFYHVELACLGIMTPWGSGPIAVDIFMLLSGFLMGYHWIIRKDRFNDFKHQTIDFYLRRIFRIVPLYYILLAVALYWQDSLFEMRDYIAHIVPPPWGITTTHVDLSASNVISHYLFLFGFIPKYVNSNMLPDWSLGLEMQFYLIFPFLMLSITRYGAFSVILTLVILSYMTNDLIGLYLSQGILGNFPQPAFIPFKINIFAAGISIAFIYFNKDNSKIVGWAGLAMLCLYNAKIQVWVAALFIVFMLIFNNDKNEFFGKLMSTRMAKFLGDTSYPVYLVHIMIYTPILYWLFHQKWFMSLQPSPRLFIAIIFTAVPVYSISYLLHRTIEVTGIKVGRLILNKKWVLFKRVPLLNQQ